MTHFNFDELWTLSTVVSAYSHRRAMAVKKLRSLYNKKGFQQQYYITKILLWNDGTISRGSDDPNPWGDHMCIGFAYVAKADVKRYFKTKKLTFDTYRQALGVLDDSLTKLNNNLKY